VRLFQTFGLWDVAVFDPGTLAIASVVAGGIGTATSVLGAISSGEAQSQAAAYQAQVARNNATIASQNAEYATRAGNEKAEQASLAARQQDAAVRSAIAANDIDVNTGSAADVQAGQAEQGELNTNQTVTNAALTAYGYRSQSTNFTAEAGLEQAQSGYDATAGFVNAGGDLLSGASSLGFKWAGYQLQAANPSAGAGNIVGSPWS